MEPLDINKEFNRIVQDITLPSVEAEQSATTNLEGVRQQLVDHLIDHLLSLDAYDSSDLTDNDIRGMTEVLTMYIHRDFRSIHEFNIGDSVVVEGETIFMLVDESDMSYDAIPLLPGSKLTGAVENLIVTEIPDIAALQAIRRGVEISHDNSDSSLTTVPFGLALLLENPIYIDIDGTHELLPEHLTLVLPLNYPTLQLSKDNL